MVKISNLIKDKFNKHNFVILFFSTDKDSKVDYDNNIITVNYVEEIVWPSHVETFDKIFTENCNFINQSLEYFSNAFAQKI